MKVRHKKIIFLTILSLMGIGMLTFSMKSLKQDEKQSIHTDNIPVDIALTITPTPSIELNPSPQPEISREPDKDTLSLLVYPLEDSTMNMNELMKEYYLAKSSSDIVKIKGLLTDVSYAPTKESLERSNIYVDEYQNLSTHTKKTYEDDFYIAFVYLEVKYFNINTPAPRLDKFLVQVQTNGSLKIYSSPMDEEMAKYYEERNQDEDVLQLIEDTNHKVEKAMEADEDLRIYLEQLVELQS